MTSRLSGTGSMICQTMSISTTAFTSQKGSAALVVMGGGSYVPQLQGAESHDAVLFGLPPRPRPELRPKDQIYNRNAPRGRYDLAGRFDGGIPCWRPQSNGLFDMSSVSPQWRGLDELANDQAFVARASEEFPMLAEALASPPDRRRAIKLMAAAFAAAGLSDCDVGAPSGQLIPAVRTPPNIIPGLPNFYSTANVLDGYAAGVVIKHNMGRPIKVEGNPSHPASLGATDVFAQAQLLDFYDPERAWAISARRYPPREKAWKARSLRSELKSARTGGRDFASLRARSHRRP